MPNQQKVFDGGLIERPTGSTSARAGLARPALAVGLLVCAGVVGAAMLLLGRSGGPLASLFGNTGGGVINEAETCLVRRGDLTIAVSEKGSLQAEHMERIRSKVQQSVTIIELIAEGTQITEEDVEAGKVLVKLDSGGMEERFTKQEITLESVEAAHTRAVEDHRIQEKQNESNIRAAELAVKFAGMEFEHYVGEQLASQVDEQTDFAALPERPDLAGAALQKRTALHADVQLAQEEVVRATDKYAGTQKLSDKGYVSGDELKADKLALNRREAELEQARLSLDLFAKYELPKEAEMRFADWQEKGLELERVKAQANAQMAQALAKLKSAQATFTLEKEQLNDLKEQIEFCTIRAERPGLVVYASSTSFWQRSRNPIEEGATVRERQEIIHMPDLSSMVAEVQIHESVVKKVKEGQSAVVTVDAYPDLRLAGVVKKIGKLPDPQHFMQDVKVFTATVAIEGEHQYLKPGMSCRAEIIIASLDDVVYVPVQAVTTRGDTKVCFVVREGAAQIRAVETGEFDDKFVEVKSGLQVGERVLLTPPLFPVADEEELAQAEQEQAPPTPPSPARGGQAPPMPTSGARDSEGTEDTEPGARRPDRADFMQRMKEAGVTTADLQRWRSGDIKPEDAEKLKKLGITPEQLQRGRSEHREPRGGR